MDNGGAPISFGSLLKQARKAVDMTQGELAEAAGCSPKTIAKIESGERRPSRQLAELLAQALGLPAEQTAEFMQWARNVTGPLSTFSTGPLSPRDATRGNGATHAALPSVEVVGAVEVTPNNLPVPPTEFLGREALVVTARSILLRPYTRLLTLLGPGGVGKTRVALEVAGEVLPDFGEGVYFVPLGPVSDPDLVLPTIARTLGLPEAPGVSPVDSLKAHLRDRHVLLLLDNFEQVVGAAPQLADLLSGCPGLKLLVTSREALSLRGEREVPVPPLTLPDCGAEPSPEVVAHSEAVRLFVARAQDRLFDFELSGQNAGVIAAIACRLEGLPLAVELAAAQVKRLSPQAILDGLEERLEFLKAPLVDLPTRQQTLRNAIAWSYNLLDGAEQPLFRQLGVFVGGFTSWDAHAVCAAEGAGEAQTLALLESLVDKSLLRYSSAVPSDVGEQPRFDMLETIREYALEQLRECGEAAALEKRHALHFMALAERAEPELRGANQAEWLERLEEAHDNVRAALRWAGQEAAERDGMEAAEVGLRIGAALWRFWNVRGYYSEGRGHLRKAVDAARSLGVEGEHMIRGLRAAGTLVMVQGDMPLARPLQEESLALSRKIGDKHGMAIALNELGRIAWHQGDFASARTLYEESLQLARETGDKAAMSAALGNLGIVARGQGDFALARTLLEETLEIKRAMGDKRSVALVLVSLGSSSVAQGDHISARTFYEEALPIYREIGDKHGTAMVLSNLGFATFLGGDYAAARELLEEAHGLSREIEDRLSEATILNMLGSVASAKGDYALARSYHEQSLRISGPVEEKQSIADALISLAALTLAEGEATGDGTPERAAAAVRLLAAVEGFLEATEATVDKYEHDLSEQTLATARTLLTTDEYERAWAEGQGMSVERAVAYALSRSM
jgi:predicted ATPase/transcriptional regulator with XRE-family HTH domain/Tfp pilus assembly protein PilF